ncbi:protein ABHD18-like [Lytechinus variegatus]|uniref:protein ABHD18-like n=1 Tax=Lytechinus variegatus TaxID=7654 RepID=UPI001BB19BBC|nr:protein ABHD18-like [Lytechinus variegatus]
MYEKASAFDRIYRSLLLSKFFTRGWGNPATIKRQFDFLRVLADRSSCQHLVNEHYPVNIDSDVEKGEVRIVDGNFRSPFDRYLPNIMPKEVKTARFQLIVPTRWPSQRKPVCIHMAGTGDHFFWRRRTFLARPLIKEYGIGSLLIENPFYGCRKPKEQLRSSLRHVNELFVMGGGLILEGLVMLHWCEKQGFGPLGLTGISMGGHMASLTATNWHKPIPLIPCLSWSSATPVFTEGVLSGSIPWPVLVTQYMGQHLEYEREIMKRLQKCPKTDAFRLGQEFAWSYPESLDDLQDVTDDQPARTHQHSHHKNSKTVPEDLTKPPRCNQSKNTVQELNQCNGRTESCSMSDEKQNNKSAIDDWPMSKLDLQAAVVNSLNGSPSELNRDLGSCQTDDVRVECAQDSKTHVSNLNSSCKGPSAVDSEIHIHHTKCRYTDTNKGSTLDVQDIAGVQFSTDKNIAANPKISEKRSGGTHEKENKKRKNKGKITDMENYQELKKEALEFMRGVMDVTTFVGNFSTPVDSSLVIIVSALKDGYIPRKGVPGLDDIWPGVEVRYIDGGHVAAFLFKQAEFRKAINDAFNKYLIKYESMPTSGSKSDLKSRQENN